MRPSEVDNLTSREGEPPGWHVREKTEDGYPLMGSSPAERVEALERQRRVRRQAMRDHPFEGEGRYCQHWRVLVDRMTGAGRLTMRDQCGYPPDTHPLALEQAWDEAHREAWARRTVAAAGKSWSTHLAKFSGAVLPRG